MKFNVSDRDRILFQMINSFKKLSPKEQGFVLGLAEGLSICKPDFIEEESIDFKKLIDLTN